MYTMELSVWSLQLDGKVWLKFENHTAFQAATAKLKFTQCFFEFIDIEIEFPHAKGLKTVLIIFKHITKVHNFLN